MDTSEAARLKALEDENAKLKRLLADIMLDNVVLKDLLGTRLQERQWRIWSAILNVFGPHAFHHMLVRHAAKTCTSVVETVATSRNFRHTDVLTTLQIYGQISRLPRREFVTGETVGDVLEN